MSKIFNSSYAVDINTDKDGLYHAIYTFTEDDKKISLEGVGSNLFDAIDDVIENTAAWCSKQEEKEKEAQKNLKNSDNTNSYLEKIDDLHSTIDCYECKMNELLEENEDLQITVSQLKKEIERLKNNSFTADDFLDFLNNRR